jgi:4-amino-4-deoxy-L-arabinose transferase-like glycosyltransferase
MEERDNPERYYPIALVVLCAVVFFYGLGRAPFLGPDEPRYAEVAREMYQTGDWITPRLGGIKWFEKPALTYWLSSAGYALFGENEFAARFGVSLVAAFGVLALYFFGRRAHSARLGYLSAAAVATCGLWPGFARGATFDLPLTVAIEIALFSFFLWHSKDSQIGRNRLWYVFCFALGAATLAKGLVGIVLPLAVITPYLFLTGGWKGILRPRLLALGALIFFATAAVWYAPVIAKNGREFIDEFFIGHHFQRYLSNKYRHPQPFYFFLVVVFMGSFPWSFYLAASAWRAVRNWRGATKDQFTLFLWLWVIAPVVFFSFSHSKLPGYILPVFPAVGLLIGRELERWWGETPSTGRRNLCLVTALWIIAVGVGFGVYGQEEFGMTPREAWTLPAIAALVAVTSMILLAMRGGRAATLFLPFGLAVVVIATVSLVFPTLGRRESLRDLSLTAVRAARPSERLIFFVNQDHGINFYATGLPLRDNHSDLVTVTSVDEIALLIEASRSQSVLILSRKRSSDGVAKAENLQVEELGDQRFNARCSPGCDWVLLRAQKNVSAERQ